MIYLFTTSVILAALVAAPLVVLGQAHGVASYDIASIQTINDLSTISKFASDPMHVSDYAELPDEHVALQDIRSKFDVGFYEKLEAMSQESAQHRALDDATKYHDIVVVVTSTDGDISGQSSKIALQEELADAGSRSVWTGQNIPFMTASVPVNSIVGIASHDKVALIGDGERKMRPTIDTAKKTINALPENIIASDGSVFNGTGITVAILDNGINHELLNSKIINSTFCTPTDCTDSGTNPLPPNNRATHGTRVAGIIAAEGLASKNGIAPGVSLLDATLEERDGVLRTSSTIHAIDWAISAGADVINMSYGTECTGAGFLVDEWLMTSIVDNGVVPIASVGNSIEYGSILAPGCTTNAIGVGAINDRTTPLSLFSQSSLGPADITHPRIKPDIVAPGAGVQVIQNHNTGSNTGPGSGTSFSAPMVSSVASLILQANPDLEPVEVRAALLLGANWMGPIPCSSVQYEWHNTGSGCSYAMQTGESRSTDALNHVGFGLLNANASITYAGAGSGHIISDQINNSTVRHNTYTFNVTDTAEPVMVMLTWQAKVLLPHLFPFFDHTTADLNFKITDPNDNLVASADSRRQNNEFAIFMPESTGNYTITVSGFLPADFAEQDYALASTVPMTAVASSNNPPAMMPSTHIITPSSVNTLILSVHDEDGDQVSIRTADAAAAGDIYLAARNNQIYYIHNAGAVTSPYEITITPNDGNTDGSPAVITLIPESLPAESEPPSKSLIRDWSVLELKNTHPRQYSKTIPGPDYPVSGIYAGALNMLDADLLIVEKSGTEHSASLERPTRVIGFDEPIEIDYITMLSMRPADDLPHVLDQSVPVWWDTVQLSNDPLFNHNNVKQLFVGFIPAYCIAPAAEHCSETASHASESYVDTSVPEDSLQSTMHIAPDGVISDILVSVNATDTIPENATITLTTPIGTKFTLHDRTSDSYDFSAASTDLSELVGASMTGNWTMSFDDRSLAKSGTIHHWNLDITYTPYHSVYTGLEHSEQAGSAANIKDIEFSRNGSKLFLLDARLLEVREYSLPEPYNVANLTYTTSYDLTSVTGFDNALFVAYGLEFSTDGTKMFVAFDRHVLASVCNYLTEHTVNGVILGLDLTEPFDLNTVTNSPSWLDICSQGGVVNSLEFSDDGTRMIMLEGLDNTVDVYGLDPPYEFNNTYRVSSAEFLDVSENDWLFGLNFVNDGNMVFFMNWDDDLVYRDALSSPYDVSTTNSYAGYYIPPNPEDGGLLGDFVKASNLYVLPEDYLKIFAVSDDGTRMYGALNNTIYQYRLTDIPDLYDDTLPPTISVSNKTILTDDQSATVSLGPIMVSDNMDPRPLVSHNATSVFPRGTSTVQWTVFDAYGNTNTAVQTVEVLNTTEATPPALEIVRAYPLEENVTNPTVVFGARFTKPVTGVNAEDFDVNGTAAAYATGVSVINASTYNVTVTAWTNGTASLVLNPENDIADLRMQPLGNRLTGTTSYSFALPLDNTMPQLLSITRQDSAQDTNSSAITFVVEFSEPVRNVDATDFAVGGTAAANITSVRGSGLTWNIDVTVTRDGTVHLMRTPSLDIADLSDNSLDVSAPVQTNQTYVVDLVPAILSIERQSPTEETTTSSNLTFRVTFSEPVQNADAADFVTGGSAASNITSVHGSGSVWNVTTTVAAQGTVSIMPSPGHSILDITGNALDLDVRPAINHTYVVDYIPVIRSIERADPVTENTDRSRVAFRITFSEPVQNVDAADFAAGGTSTATITSVRGSESVWNINVTIINEGTVHLALAPSLDIIDLSENSLNVSAPIQTNQTYVVDLMPVILSIERQSPAEETTTSSSLTFRVTFSESVQNVDAADFAGNLPLTIFEASPSIYDVTVIASSPGRIALSISDSNNIQDIQGNSLINRVAGVHQSYTYIASSPSGSNSNAPSP